MFRTRSLSALFIFLLVAGVFVGCGGESSSSPSTPSPYAGHWKGTWVDSIWGQTGTLDITVITISGGGSIAGSVINADNESGTVVGRIGDNGKIACFYYYRWDTYRAIGALSTNASGHLVGNVTEYDIYNFVARQDSLDLIKQ
jgi:CBS domain-containing protein